MSSKKLFLYYLAPRALILTTFFRLLSLDDTVNEKPVPLIKYHFIHYYFSTPYVPTCTLSD